VNDDLVARIVEASELRGDFVLSSGQRSSVYFDKFRFLTDPELLRDVARAVAAVLPEGLGGLGAPEGAVMLLAGAVALETGLPVTVVRKEPKRYGTRTQIEGADPAGARLALLEDVSTTGQQVQRAAELLEEHGGTIDMIVLAIDRGGGEHLREAGYRVEALVSVRPSG
jgi:orotate phosphoribosyltransferase